MSERMSGEGEDDEDEKRKRGMSAASARESLFQERCRLAFFEWPRLGWTP
jgi:hypothetical protein